MVLRMKGLFFSCASRALKVGIDEGAAIVPSPAAATARTRSAGSFKAEVNAGTTAEVPSKGSFIAASNRSSSTGELSFAVRASISELVRWVACGAGVGKAISEWPDARNTGVEIKQAVMREPVAIFNKLIVPLPLTQISISALQPLPRVCRPCASRGPIR
jgi:hypothetical protein